MLPDLKEEVWNIMKKSKTDRMNGRTPQTMLKIGNQEDDYYPLIMCFIHHEEMFNHTYHQNFTCDCYDIYFEQIL